MKIRVMLPEARTCLAQILPWCLQRERGPAHIPTTVRQYYLSAIVLTTVVWHFIIAALANSYTDVWDLLAIYSDID